MLPKRSKTQRGCPQTLQNRVPERPGELKCTQKALEMSQVTPESVQEAAKKRPRGFKSHPRAAKSRPRDVQEASKTASDPSQAEPGTLQDEF